MNDIRKPRGNGQRTHVFEWVENRLRPVFDSPPLGTYSAAEAVDLQECPVCGRSMQEHTIDHSAQNTLLICPVDHAGFYDRDAYEPVNEFGMTVRKSTGSTRTADTGEDADDNLSGFGLK
ncbi:MAG: hypothetical protein JWQ68_1361 [Cryobacterium sp.]|jgi:hypothetical protein|nr:hypothetical protein [Cryobacterium sp.]